MEKSIKKLNVLTSKDLDYLKDIFSWNSNLYKTLEYNKENIIDNEIKKIYTECSNFFYDNMNLILDLLEKGYDEYE